MTKGGDGECGGASRSGAGGMANKPVRLLTFPAACDIMILRLFPLSAFSFFGGVI